MENIYDLAILGAGPAGICAAIYATRAKLNTIWLDKKFVQGGQIVDTYEVDNYPGLPGITGLDLGEAMAGHAEKLGMKPQREPVRSIETEHGIKVIRTKKNEYRARAVIIACGATHRHLGIPGEEELSGMGVSYCATCDGMFFRGKEVAVVGGGSTALQDAEFLSEYCSKVYLIHRRESFRGEERIVEGLKKKENVTFILDSVVKEICGEIQVEGLELQNLKTGEKKKLPVSGVFVAVGQIPKNDPFENVVKLDADGFILASEDCMTSGAGIFAAGDCRTKEVRQLTTAAADGAVAALAACKYLAE